MGGASRENNFSMFSPLQTLTNLQELYLQNNRLKDLPSIFHFFELLNGIGLDWFFYLTMPLKLPKICNSSQAISIL